MTLTPRSRAATGTDPSARANAFSTLKADPVKVPLQGAAAPLDDAFRQRAPRAQIFTGERKPARARLALFTDPPRDQAITDITRKSRAKSSCDLPATTV